MRNHGDYTDNDRHVGDLGNIQANQDGTATISIIDNEVKLMGFHSVVGRSCVIHAGEDDLGKGGNEESKKTGNSGARIACGVIGVAWLLNKDSFNLKISCGVGPSCSGELDGAICQWPLPSSQLSLSPWRSHQSEKESAYKWALS